MRVSESLGAWWLESTVNSYLLFICTLLKKSLACWWLGPTSVSGLPRRCHGERTTDCNRQLTGGYLFESFFPLAAAVSAVLTHTHTRLPLFLFQLSISTMIFPFFFFDSLSFFDDWKWQHNSSYCLDDGRKWNATQDIHHFRRPELAAYWPYTTIEMVFFSRLHLSLFFISFSHLHNDKQMPVDFHLDLFFVFRWMFRSFAYLSSGTLGNFVNELFTFIS